MKRILVSILLIIISTLFSGCGAIFGGHIGECQKHGNIPGTPARKIRPVALAFDILTLPFMVIALPVDFATGGIYKPCSLPIEVVDSLDKRKEQLQQKTSGRDKFLSIFNDPTQGLFCEDLNIGIEHPFTKNFTAGFDFATVHPIGMFYVNPISPSQRDWPGTVYYGNDFKLEFKFFTNKKPSTYTGINIEYKHLWYNNVPFVDVAPNGSDSQIYTYTRDEKENVFGIDFIYGHEFALCKKLIMIDYFFGFGLRAMYRHINTYASKEYLGHLGGLPLPFDDFTTNGYSSTTNGLPTPILGIKIGFNIFRKKL